jgi:hypothetical protein
MKSKVIRYPKGTFSGLTRTQASFVRHYIAHNCNGRAAARAMGHKGSDDAARALASYYLNQSDVGERIDLLLESRDLMKDSAEDWQREAIELLSGSIASIKLAGKGRASAKEVCRAYKAAARALRRCLSPALDRFAADDASKIQRIHGTITRYRRP